MESREEKREDGVEDEDEVDQAIKLGAYAPTSFRHGGQHAASAMYHASRRLRLVRPWLHGCGRDGVLVTSHPKHGHWFAMTGPGSAGRFAVW
jgi:hypothetical protein